MFISYYGIDVILNTYCMLYWLQMSLMFYPHCVNSLVIHLTLFWIMTKRSQLDG